MYVRPHVLAMLINLKSFNFLLSFFFFFFLLFFPPISYSYLFPFILLSSRFSFRNSSVSSVIRLLDRVIAKGVEVDTGT